MKGNIETLFAQSSQSPSRNMLLSTYQNNIMYVLQR